jgi:hypothetical protein
VTDNHQQSFVDLINSGKFKKHFYIRNLSDKDNFQFVNMLPYGSTNKMNHSETCFTQFHDNGNSGANACSAAVCMGYKKIILLGVDCNYVEFVDGSKKDGPGLIMDKTPDTNPNYWFDDYQQKGDQYNIPDGIKFHMPTWNMFAYRAAHAGIEVVNCSPISNLRCFRKISLQDALK